MRFDCLGTLLFGERATVGKSFHYGREPIIQLIFTYDLEKERRHRFPRVMGDEDDAIGLQVLQPMNEICESRYFTSRLKNLAKKNTSQFI